MTCVVEDGTNGRAGSLATANQGFSFGQTGRHLLRKHRGVGDLLPYLWNKHQGLRVDCTLQEWNIVRIEAANHDVSKMKYLDAVLINTG